MSEADWLRLQKVVFARYVQQKLRGSDNPEWKHFEVKDLLEQMKDGTLLVDLMTAMSGKKMAKPIKKETVRIKIITNCNEALKFVEECGVDVKKVRAQAEDLVDAKEKVVMALVFQIIVTYLKFDDGSDEGKSSGDVRDALALWLNNKVDGYKGVQPVEVKMKKLPTKVFHDGVIFNALVHKMRPKLVNFDALDPADGIKNLNQALDLAEKYLNIEKYVTAEDITNMDELSIIVYLSDWFSGVILLQKQDIAARRIGKLVDLTILHDRLRGEYTTVADEVRAWIDAKIKVLNERKFDDTLNGVKQLLEQFYAYKGTEKGEYVGKKLDSAGVFNNLQARLANHKRPVWVPAEGTKPSDLDAKFEELAQVEIKRSVDLNAELARQIKLHKMHKRFQANAAKLTQWAKDKEGYLNTKETITSVDSGEDALETLGVHSKEQEHVAGSQLADLTKLGQELEKERFEHSKDVQSTSAGLAATFAKLNAANKAKATYLEGELQQQKDLNDKLCREFAEAAGEFDNWLKTKRNALSTQAEGQLDSQLAFVKSQLTDTNEADAKVAQVATKEQAVIAREIGLNPHSNLTTGDLKAQWAQYQVLLHKKVALLEEQIEEAKRGGLTPEQAEEINVNFNYFDKEKQGFLGKKELRVCLQSLGEESRPQDIAKLLQLFDTDKNGTIKKNEFVQFMKANLGDSGTAPEMVTAFRYLCFSKPHITADQLINVVNDKSFKDHHVQYLQAFFEGFERYDYEMWVQDVFSR